jgi:hypothetical protein
VPEKKRLICKTVYSLAKNTIFAAQGHTAGYVLRPRSGPYRGPSSNRLSVFGVASKFGDHPDSVDDAGNVAKDRQQDVNPEVLAQTHLKEDAQRGQNDGQDYSD